MSIAITTEFTERTSSDTIAIRELLLLDAQLALLLVMAHRLAFPSPFAPKVAYLLIATFVGFNLHALAPRAVRSKLFVAISAATILAILGAADGGYLLAVAGALALVCWSPARLWIRVVVMTVLGCGLAALRARALVLPGLPELQWSILASMFMYRAVVYLYQTRHRPRGLWETLGYFLMLPNVCFPLFPVVDYRRFVEGYFREPALVTYRRGIYWMFIGLIHYVVYRLVYVYWAIGSDEVVTTLDKVRFLSGEFLLYTRVSAQFHFVVGILLLFGFSLPRTHDRYYLSRNLADVWHRTNIYFTDFMKTVLYYPIAVRLQRLIDTRKAAVLSVVIVFVATTLLHSYQAFWLRGTFDIRDTDVVFWSVLCIGVIIPTVRKQAAPKRGWRAAVGIAATFVTMCVLFSVWNSESLNAWWYVVTQ